MRRIALLSPAALALLAITVPALADTVQIAPTKDNTLYESAGGTLSNGGLHLFAGLTAQGPADNARRGLVAFDVAGNVPAGATITDVTLTLNMSMTIVGPKPVSIHRLESDWGEGTADAPGQEGAGAAASGGDATWLHTFSPAQFWLTAGGDFDPIPSATTIVNQDGPYTWGSTPEMIADVEDWKSDPSGNFGWVLVGDESSVSAKRFDTRESNNAPVLTVTFELPVGVPATSTWGLAIAALSLLVGTAVVLRRRPGDQRSGLTGGSGPGITMHRF